MNCPRDGCPFEIPEGTDPGISVALLTLHGGSHPPLAPAPRPKPTPVRRPQLSAGGTAEGWGYFLSRWETYAQAIQLVDADVASHLLDCLDPDLRRDVTRNAVAAGPRKIGTYALPELLAAIRPLAVIDVHCLAAWHAFSNMTQDRGESVRSYVARLRGQAEVCQLNHTCTACGHMDNTSEERVAAHLGISMADPDIRLDMFKQPNRNMSTAEMITFTELRVTATASNASVATRTTTSAITEDDDREEALHSSYKVNQRPTPPHSAIRGPRPQATPNRGYQAKGYQATPNRGYQATPTQQSHAPNRPTPQQPAARQPPNGKATPCCYCGRQGHGERARPAIRRQQCPAFGATCSNCQRLHYYADQCWQGPAEQENAITETVLGMGEGTLRHQHWDGKQGMWLCQRSPPQPTLNVELATSREDYTAHGHTLRKEVRGLMTTALADTGCQSCLAGPTLQAGLQLKDRDLIPASLAMTSASGHPLPIMGAALIRLRVVSSQRTTRLMVYFSREATKLYLSLAACTDLGLIGDCFSKGMSPRHDYSHAPPHPVLQLRDHHTHQVQQVRQGGKTQHQVRQQAPNVHQVPQQGPTGHQAPTHTATPTPPARPCSCPQRAPPPSPPTTLPFPGTAVNRRRLESYLLDLYSASAFNVCEHQPLPMMSGPPLSLNIDPTAVPKPCHTPIAVPIHWQEEVKAGLDRDVRLGVLEMVPLGTPVTWCHRMVICTKKSGSLRRTINFQPLNQHATRETHHCPSPFHQARAVPRGTKKTVFDAWNGYHSVALVEDDRHFTTFITPWGRYRYCTAPQGYIASGDAYTARYDALVAHVSHKTKCVDDALLWSQDLTEAFHQAVEWLHICATNGITLNPTKFRFGEDKVEFAGFTITPTEVRPADKFTAAIRDFPTPTNITDIRAWFGLVNQVSYAFSMTSAMAPFRHLLKTTTPFEWTEELEEALTTSKLHICHAITEGVNIFDRNRPTCLATDWSKDGVGFWLTQKHCRCPSRDPFCCRDGWRVTLVGSRFTHAAESRYAPVEGEALAVADALDRARHFVLGCSDLVVAVDHKPLLKLFGDRCLEDIPNPRLQNLKEKTLRYRFRMVYVPGVKNLTSDALSRHPSGPKSPPRLHLQDDVPQASDCPDAATATVAALEEVDHLEHALCSAIASIPISWEQLQAATAADPSMQELIFCVEAGISDDKSALPPSVQPYWNVLSDLSVVDDVVCLGERIIIPPPLRQTCLEALHAAHQGVSSMSARAMSSLYWPGLTQAIKTLRDRCPSCQGNAPSQPAMPSTPPIQSEYPFQHICADYFHHEGSAYLVLVDRYSGWPIVTPATNGARGLATTLVDTFASFGVPTTLTSDGGPEFAAHSTTSLLQQWGVTHRTSSAYFPHANNRAETGVKTIKRLIAGNTGPGGTLQSAFHKALLQYRNCPSPDTHMSPAMCLFGRPTRDIIPSIPARLTLQPANPTTIARRDAALGNRRSLGKARWDEHTQNLPPLARGDRVLVQNQTGGHPTKWDKSGTITEVLQYHQYLVTMDGNGRSTTRNRRFLRPLPPLPGSQLSHYLQPLPYSPPQGQAPPGPAPLTTQAPPQIQAPPGPAPQAAPAQLQGQASQGPPPQAAQPQTPRPPPRGPPSTPQTPTVAPPRTPRSYATVTASPRPATPATVASPRLPPPTPARPPLRRSTRATVPIDRLGVT